MLSLPAKIEGILFAFSRPMSIVKLAGIFEVKKSEISEALDILSGELEDRGLVLVQGADGVMLRLSPQLSEIFSGLKQKEEREELSKSSLETLALILYKDAVSKMEIDEIRGVNSRYALRSLLKRGLVRKIGKDDSGKKDVKYYPTTECLSFLGIRKKEELPEYQRVSEEFSSVVDSALV